MFVPYGTKSRKSTAAHEDARGAPLPMNSFSRLRMSADVCPVRDKVPQVNGGSRRRWRCAASDELFLSTENVCGCLSRTGQSPASQRRLAETLAVVVASDELFSQL